MIRSVIFDIDNTLYDYDAANRAALAALSDYTAIQFEWDSERGAKESISMMNKLHRKMGEVAASHNRMIRFQNILEENDLPIEPHALNMYDVYWHTLIDNSVVSEGADDVMRELKSQGIRIGIGTDMTAHIQFVKLRALGLLEYIDFVVTSEEAGCEKPQAEFFGLCISKSGVSPEECLFVGDNFNKDCKGAVNAGLKALWFTPPDKDVTLPDNMGEVCRIERMTEILDHISEGKE